MLSKVKCRVEEVTGDLLSSPQQFLLHNLQCIKSLQSKHSVLLCIVQNDGATTVLVFAPICTAPVLNVGGCTDIVSATGDCNGTANALGSSSSK